MRPYVSQGSGEDFPELIEDDLPHLLGLSGENGA
jgi:hypothetical protein